MKQKIKFVKDSRFRSGEMVRDVVRADIIEGEKRKEEKRLWGKDFIFREDSPVISTLLPP